MSAAERHDTQYEAVLAAIEELRTTGGGMVWVCREDCASVDPSVECDCDPSGFYVPGDA